MEYLKSYNYEDGVRKLINWKMINDIKDLSLEYIDEGFTLSIYFFKRGIFRHYLIKLFVLKFNHDISKETFPSVKIPFSKGEYIYKIMLNGKEGWFENTAELREISKSMYPKENIMI